MANRGRGSYSLLKLSSIGIFTEAGEARYNNTAKQNNQRQRNIYIYINIYRERERILKRLKCQ